MDCNGKYKRELGMEKTNAEPKRGRWEWGREKSFVPIS
jgi:hypothetical protein